MSHAPPPGNPRRELSDDDLRVEKLREVLSEFSFVVLVSFYREGLSVDQVALKLRVPTDRVLEHVLQGRAYVIQYFPEWAEQSI